jgi:hypothetical protein
VEYVVNNAEEIIHALPTQYLSEAMVDTNDDRDVATTAGTLDEDDINAALTVSPPTYAIM